MGKNTDKFYVGVDLGGTNIQAGVVNGDNKLRSRVKSKTKAAEGSDAVVRRLAQTVREAVHAAGCELAQIGGVGVGAPGAIDVDKGVVLKAVNLGWRDFALAQVLAAELRMRVTLDNDVNVATWGEYVAGVGGDYPDLLGVWVGTGIGGGLVLNGRLYHGHRGTAGEIGHLVIHADAPLGRRTLENCASRTAMTNLLTQLIHASHASKIVDLVDGDLSGLRSRIIARALDENDKLTKMVVKQAAQYVGIAIANAVTLLSLPCAVVGGGFTTAVDKRWREWVQDSFEEHVFPDELRSCAILPSELGDDAGVVGAAILARERFEAAGSDKKK